MTAPLRALPDFVIVGAQKAGTTSLYAYLSAERHVLPAAAKEVHFFDTARWDRGPAEYRSNFPLRVYIAVAGRLRRRKVITGEATPYYLYHPLAAERLARTVPDVKVIVLLRDPVERTLSHYRHELRAGRENLSLAEALAAESRRVAGREAALIAGQDPADHLHHRNHSYVGRSRYAAQVARYLEAFPAEQVLVLRSEDLFADDPQAKARLADFLGLPPLRRPFPAENVGSDATADTGRAAIRRILAEEFAEEERELRRLLGHDFGWARVGQSHADG